MWRPKPIDKYKAMDYSDDIDDSVFIFKRYGKAMRRKKIPFKQTRDSHDIHLWDTARDQQEFDKDFRINPDIDASTKETVAGIIESYWDCFYSDGVRKPILDFEFCIDTGSSAPVCCRKPHYGPHESRIIMAQIEVLLDNGWIDECEGAWGSSIVLAAKPHQEHITDIKDFIWRMCVSYRALNQVTLPFEYPIPRCDDAIDNFGDSAGRLYFISLDNKTGYHQISVRQIDREKLAFFAPNGKKYTFGVMPFGPRNAPAYYTAMMAFFQDEWNALFEARHPDLCGLLFHRGSRVIIDDILLWATIQRILLLYFACVCEIFLKYRVTFQLKKCDFLKDRIEYVGHDITPDGNCPAQSKFNLITDWPLPATGSALISFIGLLTFYFIYCPWFEIRVKPLRALERLYHRKPLPAGEWTTELTGLWNELKLGITSSPCLARYDASLPCFLKTDWSANGMGWVLMQPDNSDKSKTALVKLYSSGECDFDVTMGGARLRPVRFGSRQCTERERHYHSFVGEAGCGRWSISQNRKFLWGAEFFWLCDCSAMKEVLDYTGSIHQIRRWAQELLGYHFRIFHRPARMMRDVDGLSRRFENPLVEQHFAIASDLRSKDEAARPAAYASLTFHSGDPLKCQPTANITAIDSITVQSSFASHVPPVITDFTIIANLPIRTVHQPASRPPSANSLPLLAPTCSQALLPARTVAWISLTPQFGAIPAALLSLHTPLSIFCLICQPDDWASTPICRATLPSGYYASYNLSDLATALASTDHYSVKDDTMSWFLRCFDTVTGFNCTCPHLKKHSQLLWLSSLLPLLHTLFDHYALSCFYIAISLPTDLDCGNDFASMVEETLPYNWTSVCGPTSSALYDDAVHAKRWVCTGLRQIGMFPKPSPTFPPVSDHRNTLGNHVNSTQNAIQNNAVPLPAAMYQNHNSHSHPANLSLLTRATIIQ
jgi:hypothetical protein